MSQATSLRVMSSAFALAAAGLLLPAEPAAAGTPGSWSDFNGDGWSDLAIAMPYATIQGVRAAGAVIVLYGGENGLTSTGSQHWNADTVLEAGNDLQVDARFGFSLAAGDFDKDGYGDLAIAAPFKDVDAAVGAGKVYVLFGSSGGLTATRTQTWAPSGPDVTRGRAGWSMTTLDWFDFTEPRAGDGYADLAIGAPLTANRGRVHIVAGQRFAQLPNGITTTFDGQNGNSLFGRSLAAGDFNDTLDGRGVGLDDLAVGAPSATVGGDLGAGEVVVLQRGSNGLVQRKYYDQDRGTIPDTAQAHDSFGYSLAAGDLDGDGLDDLAVGVPGEDVFASFNNEAQYAGIVQVLPSDPTGIGLQSTAQTLRQGTVGIGGYPEDSDQFGHALAIADFGGQSTRKDLAIGAFGEHGPAVNGHYNAGAIAVVDNDGSGLDVGSTVWWSQASTGIAGAPEEEDRFGWALTAGQYGRGEPRDLVIGVQGEGVIPSAGGDEVPGAGQIHVLYGGSGGLSATDSQVWNVDSPGVPRKLKPDERFGYSVR